MTDRRKTAPEKITAFLRLLFRPGDVFEVRVLDAERPGDHHPHIESGYFDWEHIDEVPKALDAIMAARGMYVTMNPVAPALLARCANRLQRARRGETTSDADIVCRRGLLLDIDPVRPAGISTTEEEKERAFDKAVEIRGGLDAMGWPAPLVVDSGNGYYLIYLVDLPADDGGLVHRCLQALQVVGTASVHIDIAVANPSRICRLPGTWNCKGDSLPDRPHRLAEIIEAPTAPQAVSRALLENLAQTAAPGPETAQNAPCAPTTASVPSAPVDTTRPGDDFNRRGDLEPILEAHGWQRIGDTTGNQHWRRPGKTSGNHSATFDGQCFYVFSSAAVPFEANRGYSKFQALAMLGHGGDFAAAARALAAQGFGAGPLANDVDISGILAKCSAPRAEGVDSPCPSPHTADSQQGPTPFDVFQPRTLAERFAEDFSLNPPVIHGLLREGETMNLIASTKIGKSWLVSALAISVASGIDWLGFPVVQGPVLHIDNELHANTSTFRYHRVAAAMGVPTHLFSHQLTTVSLRGRLADLNRLGTLFAAYPPGAFKLVIIDAFYRALPAGTDENDNGAIANLYNLIDLYAMRLGCAFALIHHTSKGNQSGKFLTDVGAGAGSQSRAVDTHTCLRQHEDQNLVVLEAAARSWPPIQPLALEWRWPLFIPVPAVDTSALLGAAKPAAKKAAGPTVDAFVDSCVAAQDPCSERAVLYSAQQTFGMTRRAAEDMLALARERGLVEKVKADGAYMKYVKVRAGLTGDKAQWVAALLANSPDSGVAEIARRAAVAERYVREVRQQLAVGENTEQQI